MCRCELGEQIYLANIKLCLPLAERCLKFHVLRVLEINEDDSDNNEHGDRGQRPAGPPLQPLRSRNVFLLPVDRRLLLRSLGHLEVVACGEVSVVDWIEPRRDIRTGVERLRFR